MNAGFQASGFPAWLFMDPFKIFEILSGMGNEYLWRGSYGGLNISLPTFYFAK